jgi:putative DNA primase/helicase
MGFIEFKNGAKYAARNAETSDDLDAFDTAGYLLEENDLIVDIDNLPKNKIQTMMSMLNIKTKTVWTDRGAHLYFKKPQGFRWSQGFTPIGINVEYKHLKNTKAITVRMNGVSRKIERKDLISEFPEVLDRLSNEDTSLYGFDEGRNNALYSHKARISRRIRDWKKCLAFINYELFDEPLPNDEFDVVSREEDFKAGKNEEFLVSNIVRLEKSVVKYNGELYFYNGTFYDSDTDKFRRMIRSYCKEQKTWYIDEVIKQLNDTVEIINSSKDFPIQFKNGTLMKGEFIRHDSPVFSPYQINLDFDSKTPVVTEVNEFLDFVTDNDKDYKDLLLEMIGYCFVTDPSFIRSLGKFFILTGEGGNGKGTLINIIQQILGKRNFSTTALHDLRNETSLFALNGKLANFDDDVLDKPIDSYIMKTLKNISTADVVSIRKLFNQATSAMLTATFIASSNHKIKSFEKSYSFKRRIVWLPLTKRLDGFNQKFFNAIQSKEAISYWLVLAIEGYQRLYKNREFTYSEKVQKVNDEYHLLNNNTIEFLMSLTKDDFLNVPVKDVKLKYNEWCEINDYKPLNIRILEEQIKEKFGLVKKNTIRKGHNGWKYVEL